MSDNEIEKRTREVLGNSKSSMAKAIVIMSMSLDKVTEALQTNQEQVNERITKLEKSTDKRFEKLKFWSFLTDYGWVGLLIVVAIIIVMIWSAKTGDPTMPVKILK